MAAVAAHSPSHPPHTSTASSPRYHNPAMTSSSSPPQQQQRNHQRTNQRAPPPNHLPPAVHEPKPVKLATPGMGYPFPLMLSRANTPREEILASPYKVQQRPPSPRRKVTPQGDGWDTPANSSRASSFAMSSRRPSTLTSTFSDSSCSTVSSTTSDALSSSGDDVSSASSPFSERADVNTSCASDTNNGPIVPPPTTPAEHARSRIKHAGSTPGAPPPNPLVTLEKAPEMLDLDDIREASPSSPSHDRMASGNDDERKRRNPLAGGLARLSMSGSHSSKEDGLGVGPKVEVD
ncbi:Proteophosphoglycan ppg4 [Rhodotorula toruloides ATCC 204091]|uniref:Proteophosphoglycan ppg4 n=2 Tax=Rhodotorula toruloides TaxID=5286 RepID=A0A2T0AII8_RHOTO|nr:Proteophosphoglycan ppg4 [Rhodotorula toruloides ATCC 204091]KAK4331407.1 Proteophosphoglycan ppg4 [Rhodotorula toruloides]PRQ77804.1 hypothetical protein AAT19DRAFT_8872 [Rhodotorula toruloides]